MLRRRMGDEKFLAMLAELRKRYEFRFVTTEGLRALAQEFRPRGVTAEAIDTFFDNWGLCDRGVPGLKLEYKVTGAPPSVSLSGALAQSGVDEDFSIDVPVEVQFAKGPSQTIWVRSSTGEETFSEKTPANTRPSGCAGGCFIQALESLPSENAIWAMLLTSGSRGCH